MEEDKMISGKDELMSDIRNITLNETTRGIEEDAFIIYDYDKPEMIIDYINSLNEQKLFSDYIKKLVEKNGFKGDLNSKNEVNRFIQVLSEEALGEEEALKRQNIDNWLKDCYQANTEKARRNMYQLCFTFKMKLKEVYEFFTKACLEKPFNFRSLDETVFFYCFKMGLTYSDYKRLISEIENGKKNDDSLNVRTEEIRTDIYNIDSEDALISYCSTHYSCFAGNNVTSTKETVKLINEYREWLYKKEKNGAKSEKHDSKEINTEKKMTSVRNTLDSMYGFSFRIAIIDKKEKEAKIRSKILDEIKNLPDKIRKNLPQEQQIKMIIDCCNTEDVKSVSNDVLRKTFILFYFFLFFDNEDLNDYLQQVNDREEDLDTIFDSFYSDLNFELWKLGFSQLYSRNPYDWLFMLCATQDEPIEVFRDIYSEYCCNNGD